MSARDKTPKAIDEPRIKPQLLDEIDRDKFIDGERAKLKYEAAKNKGKKFHKYVLGQKEPKRRRLLKSKYYEHFMYAVEVEPFPAQDSVRYILARLFIDDNREIWDSFKSLQRVINSNERKKNAEKKSRDENNKYVRSLKLKNKRLEMKKLPKEYHYLSSDIFEGIKSSLDMYLHDNKPEDIRSSLADCCIYVLCELIKYEWFCDLIVSGNSEKTMIKLREHIPRMLSDLSIADKLFIDSD